MKIYNKIVWDKDYNILEEDSYEYNGPVVLLGGPPRPTPPPAPTPPPPPPEGPRPPKRPVPRPPVRTGKVANTFVTAGTRQKRVGKTGIDVKASSGRKSIVKKAGTPLGVGITEDLLGNTVSSTKLGG